MKQLILKKGVATLEEVAAPQVETNCVLVEVSNSCISTGTEISSLQLTSQPLWKRALKQPENVKKVIKLVAQNGLKRTANLVKNHLEQGSASGYSASGTVIAVGEDVKEFEVGDRVACAGAGYANHAQIIRVPKNLCCKVPANVSLPQAATVTLGAIALQGIRRANPTLGETFVVIGLGILGQLTSQLLKANGCRVIGIDLDLQRVNTAQKLGMDQAISPEHGFDLEHVKRLTHGHGADGVIITAATASDQVVATAFQVCRKKGRVVLVGDVGLSLRRSDFYSKEIDFFISCSYGPGRYDHNYEEHGLDYPIGYVRWTENRNMSEYLQLINNGNLKLDPLIEKVYPFADATQAYKDLQQEAKPILALLDYPKLDSPAATKLLNPLSRPLKQQAIQVAVVGAGGFAKAVHLPNLEKSNYFQIKAIVSANGHNAASCAKHYAAQYSTTDFQQVLEDETISAVVICTQHHLHATMALQALQAGKHVLLEKPLALTQTELDSIAEFYREHERKSLPILLTGFNRRFAPYINKIQNLVSQRANPLMLNYRMNAGYIDQQHWTQQAQGGGRNLGEACHIYDLFTGLTQAKIANLSATAIKPENDYYNSNDNFMVNLSFSDGSIAQLLYTAMGNSLYPKEHFEVYSDGRIAELTDYKNLTIHTNKSKSFTSKTINKGHVNELHEFAKAILQDGNWPIPLWQQIQASQIALDVESQLSGSKRQITQTATEQEVS